MIIAATTSLPAVDCPTAGTPHAHAKNKYFGEIYRRGAEGVPPSVKIINFSSQKKYQSQKSPSSYNLPGCLPRLLTLVNVSKTTR